MVLIKTLDRKSANSDDRSIREFPPKLYLMMNDDYFKMVEIHMNEIHNPELSQNVCRILFPRENIIIFKIKSLGSHTNSFWTVLFTTFQLSFPIHLI